MARPAYTDRVPGKLAALKILSSSPQEQEIALDAPLPQLDALWHYECVVSPRSSAVPPKLQSNPASPRSPAAIDHLQPADETSKSPRSPPAKVSACPRSLSPSVVPLSAPFSTPRSHAAASSAAPSPLSRFAPPPAQQALQRVFSTFDENGDGSVSTHEISRVFQKLGISKSEDSIQSLLSDSSGLVTKSEGHVDEEEFLLLFESACCFVDANASSSSVIADVDQDLLAAFHVFDKDGNGFISPAELQAVLCSLGFPQGRKLEACEDMIARVDENGDGQVDFFEFKKLFHMENPFMASIQSF
eukprot:c22541_g1_i1 orf=107-1012(+)